MDILHTFSHLSDGPHGLSTDPLLPLLHFVVFFHVASLFSKGVDNKKVTVDNEKALELDNRISA